MPNYNASAYQGANPGPFGGGWLANSGYQGPMPGTQEFQDARAAGQHPIMDWWRTQHPNWQAPGGFTPGVQWQAPQFPQPNGNTGIVPPHMQNGGFGQGIAPGEYNPSAYGPRAGMGSNASQGKPMQPQGLASLFALPTKKQQNPGFY